MKPIKVRKGSIIQDLNGCNLTVDRFEGIFAVAKYDPNGTGEVWLVPTHLKGYKLIKF